MTYSGSAYPDAFIASIVVTYSRFPGCKRARRPYEVLVITFAVASKAESEASLVEIVDILIKNTVFRDRTFKEVKLRYNYLHVLALSSPVIVGP